MSRGDRPGLLPILRHLLAYPLPRGVGWSQIFGGLLLASFGIQVTTGALLALYYSPSASDAWESVRYIEEEVRSGSLIRGVHHFGSSSFVILLGLHIIRTFVWGAYKAQRRATWVVGCMLLGCVLGFGFTGYLLPWDLRAFFGTRVGVGIAGSAPLIGAPLAKLLAGGPSVGALTLPRFYALHAVILPLATTALIALHLVLLRIHGVTPHWTHGYKSDGRTFHPHQTAKDMAGGLLLLLVLLVLAKYAGAPLGERADPQNTSYVPRPEWYFLGAQQLLRIFSGTFEILGSFVLPALAAGVLFLLPWIDRNPERDPKKRPIAMGAGAASVLAIVGLTFWGNNEMRAEERAMEERVAALEAKTPEPEQDATPPAILDESALVAKGAELYTRLGCGACHGETHLEADTPRLNFVGSALRRDWVREYLAAPHPMRYGPDGEHILIRMPDFLLDEGELNALVAHLASRTDTELFSDAQFQGTPPPDEVAEGLALFDKLDCMGCHQVEGLGDALGPDLDGVAHRLRPGYMFKLVLDPEGVLPGTAMTDFYLEEGEARAITSYLRTME